MFELPSVWNIVISTIVFMVAAWLIRRWLEENGMAKSMMRGFIVFVLAYAVSWASGEAVDWVHEKIYGKAPTAQSPADLLDLLKATGLTPSPSKN